MGSAQALTGPLNRCVQCENFVLCEECSSEQREMHDSEHLFLTIPFPLVGCTSSSTAELLRTAPHGAHTFSSMWPMELMSTDAERCSHAYIELLRGNNPFKYHPHRCSACGASRIECILYSSVPHTPTPNPAEAVTHLCAPCWQLKYAFMSSFATTCNCHVSVFADGIDTIDLRFKNDPRHPDSREGGSGLPGDVWIKSLTLDLATEFGFSSSAEPPASNVDEVNTQLPLLKRTITDLLTLSTQRRRRPSNTRVSNGRACRWHTRTRWEPTTRMRARPAVMTATATPNQ
jgi:hypothetical protein